MSDYLHESPPSGFFSSFPLSYLASNSLAFFRRVELFQVTLSLIESSRAPMTIALKSNFYPSVEISIASYTDDKFDANFPTFAISVAEIMTLSVMWLNGRMTIRARVSPSRDSSLCASIIAGCTMISFSKFIAFSSFSTSP